ncbi:MAG: hypothetical protein ABIP51_10530 [Bacteroidia bacterium]
MDTIVLKKHKTKSTSIKKVIAFIVLCILLVVLDKVYSLTPTTMANKTAIHK